MLNGNCATRQHGVCKPPGGHQSIPLLAASTSATTTELLGLLAARVGDEKGAVVGDKLLLDLERVVCVVELGIECNNSTRNSLADGVDLGRVTATLYAHPDVDCRELILANYEDRLVHLVAQDLGANETNRRTIDADESAPSGGMRDGGRGLWVLRAVS